MLYTERITALENEIESIIADLNHTFYFVEPENLHQKSSETWSAIEELEYANLIGYHYMESLQKTVPTTSAPDVNDRHKIRLFARILIKRTAVRPTDTRKISEAFTPVSQRNGNKQVRINEQKVFADLLALLEMWKKMLHSGTGEDLKKTRLKTGFLSLFTLDALELAHITLHIIRRQLEAAKKCVGIME